MDKAGPFSVYDEIPLTFFLPDYTGGGFSGVTGAVLGDFTTLVIKDGAVVTPTLYLTEISLGHYHLSNQSGGDLWKETGPGDFYVHIFHASSGTRRNFNFRVEDKLPRLLGMSLQNYKITDMIFDAGNRVTSGTLRLYETNALSNEIFRYAFTATYDGDGNLSAFNTVKEV